LESQFDPAVAGIAGLLADLDGNGAGVFPLPAGSRRWVNLQKHLRIAEEVDGEALAAPSVQKSRHAGDDARSRRIAAVGRAYGLGWAVHRHHVMPIGAVGPLSREAVVEEGPLDLFGVPGLSGPCQRLGAEQDPGVHGADFDVVARVVVRIRDVALT